MSKLHTTLILPDCHVPFHNVNLLLKVCQAARDIKPQQLVILGDFLDCYSTSRHNSGSFERLKSLDLGKEYDQGNAVLDLLLDACKSATQLDYLFGNHEDNFYRYKADGDNGKTGDALQAPDIALRLEKRGFDVHGNYLNGWQQAYIKHGKYLEMFHGTKVSEHAAATHLRRAEGSVVHGHCHRFQTFVTGKHAAYSIGWMGDRESKGFHYMPREDRARWCNGFGVVYLLDDGSFRMTPIQVWQDRFVLNGKLY